MQCGKVICVLVVASVVLKMIVFVDVSYGDRAKEDCSITGSKDYQTLGNFFTILRGFDKSAELLIVKQETSILI